MGFVCFFVFVEDEYEIKFHILLKYAITLYFGAIPLDYGAIPILQTQ